MNKLQTFTAKQFSRCPAKVYEAAREDGSAEITHDRFGGKFVMEYKVGVLTDLNDSLTRMESAMHSRIVNGYGLVECDDGKLRFRRPKPYEKAPD
jgi:hypothetical protein